MALHPGREMREEQAIENVVARDGVEPPTPAFSDLTFRVFPTLF